MGRSSSSSILLVAGFGILFPFRELHATFRADEEVLCQPPPPPPFRQDLRSSALSHTGISSSFLRLMKISGADRPRNRRGDFVSDPD